MKRPVIWTSVLHTYIKTETKRINAPLVLAALQTASVIQAPSTLLQRGMESLRQVRQEVQDMNKSNADLVLKKKTHLEWLPELLPALCATKKSRIWKSLKQAWYWEKQTSLKCIMNYLSPCVLSRPWNRCRVTELDWEALKEDITQTWCWKARRKKKSPARIHHLCELLFLPQVIFQGFIL